MVSVTSVDPPIRFLGPLDSEIVIGDADALADWLDGLYDAILGFGDPIDGVAADRPQHLDEIERLLFAIENEIAAQAVKLNDGLRVAAMSLINHFHAIDVTFGRTPGQLRKERGRAHSD